MKCEFSGPLPDIFLKDDGERVKLKAEWPKHRAKLLTSLIDIEFGGMPPSPCSVSGDLLHSSDVPSMPGVMFNQYRITAHGAASYSFYLDVHLPPASQLPAPAVLTGDGCWRYANDAATVEILSRGYAFAVFSRVEIASDNGDAGRSTGLYAQHPDSTFGAIAAWAWGYHRCVDFLSTMSAIDPSRIAIVGHSRGGKTSLLAGATDTRVAIVSANNSGCGGAGAFRLRGEGSERIRNILKNFPYWFGPKFKDYIDKEDSLPFDQHFLAAAVAPRALLLTEALGDAWANPIGTLQTYVAAKEAYRFLGASAQIGIHFREGGHGHGLHDWKTFLDFADARLRGIPPKQDFNRNPFLEIPKAFSWPTPA